MSRGCIGVFDSGLGGLTAVRELMALAPGEDIVYFGDTARVPYGGRAADTIIRYAKQDIAFLLSKNVRFLLDACGTMSSALPPEYTSLLPVPYLGVIRPASEAAARATKNKKIGVIATSATTRSGAFPRALQTLGGGIRVYAKACPMLVPLVENGFIDPGNPVASAVAKGYLAELRDAGVDTLILGCTHYPLLFGTIAGLMGDGVTLIDSGLEAAKRAAELLRASGGLESGYGGRLAFYTSDDPAGFRDTAEMFLGRALPGTVSQIDIESYESQF